MKSNDSSGNQKKPVLNITKKQLSMSGGDDNVLLGCLSNPLIKLRQSITVGINSPSSPKSPAELVRMKKIDLKLKPNKNVLELLKVPSHPKTTKSKSGTHAT